MITAFVCINVLWLLMWHFFIRRLIAFRLMEALADILPFAFIAAAVMLVTAVITRPIEAPMLLLPAKIITAAGLYAGTLYLTRAEILRESIRFLLKKKNKA